MAKSIVIENYPKCPNHNIFKEIANSVCVDPKFNPPNKKEFKILCQECDKTY